MGVKGLVEGIILQSMEDLWSEAHRQESLTFFRSRDFSMCAGIAGLSLSDQIKLLRMVKDVVDRQAADWVRPQQGNRQPAHRWRGKTALASCR